MKINGNTYAHYGFVPIRHSGFLDMPPRLGETYYDWGDHIEPLVHEDDIFWQSKELVIEVLFDQRLTDMTFRDAISDLASHKGFMELENIYGIQEVKFKEARKVLHPSDSIVTYRLVFDEPYPQVSRTISEALGGPGISVDGYSLFKDFGVLVKSVHFYDDVATLKQSPMTTFSPQKPLTDFRMFKRIEIKCVTMTSLGYVDSIKDLQAVLGAPDLRKVAYNGVEYSCFISEGFKVSSKRGINTFNIVLNVMSQVGLFQDQLFAKGLFYEGNVRKYRESLFEYSLFATGIFQQ